jgi:RNA polymerase sporulation-specific sigma factor
VSSGHGVDEVTDERLVACARAGEERSIDTLLLRHRRMVRATAAGYFLIGADHEDLVQEGMIGLYKAICEYDPRHGASFRTFAQLCVERQIITAIKTAARHKHAPLNDYVPFHRPVGEDGERTLAEVLPTPRAADPAEQVLLAERIRDLRRHCAAVLSDLEAEVLLLYVDGRSYQDIARLLRRHSKAVDNALQRVKRKLDCHVAQWDAESA